jgi:hypothetical protein
MISELEEVRRQKVLASFCKHLIGLSVAYRHKTSEDRDKPSRFSVCSGTLIIIDNVLYFLTAGHVLKALDELRACDQVEIDNARLIDTLGSERISKIPIPFDLHSARMFYIDEGGLDFGIIVLDSHYVGLLSKNRVTALSEKNWIYQNDIEFDFHAMLGFPSEYTSERLSESGHGTLSAVMLGVKKLDMPPIDHVPNRYPQFVGQLNSELPIPNIEGMSGGPIFGFAFKSGSLRYWVVALQSSWYSQERIIYGCPLPLLGSLLTTMAADA